MKHRALIIGAGRIGAGFNWNDDAYTHAGAYKANADCVKLVGFLEPDPVRRMAAEEKWHRPAVDSWDRVAKEIGPFDIASICTQPDQQYAEIIRCLKLGVKGIWCEKPYTGPRDVLGVPIQVNYLRRGCRTHQMMKEHLEQTKPKSTLFVVAKDDLHTRCHFDDLKEWWGCDMEYFKYNGPNSYFLRRTYEDGKTFETLFPMGGVNAGDCMKAMLFNLIDHMDNDKPLWSSAL